MNRFSIAAGVGALLLTGLCPATVGASGAAAAQSATSMTPTRAMGYVAMAGASDLYEIQSSQLALTKAQSPAVREFAQMMIQHHTQTTEQVTAAARAAGMTPPPPALMPMQSRMIAKLGQLSGARFDREYITQQRRAHQMALALHSTYARRGDTPQLKQVAATARPVVQQHITRLRTLR